MNNTCSSYDYFRPSRHNFYLEPLFLSIQFKMAANNPVTEFCVSPHMVKNIVNSLRDLTEWYLLGIQLGIRVGVLDRIREDFRGVDQCKIELVKYWLQSHDNVSIKTLVEALEMIDRFDCAKKLKYFCIMDLSDDEDCNDTVDFLRYGTKLKRQKEELEERKQELQKFGRYSLDLEEKLLNIHSKLAKTTESIGNLLLVSEKTQFYEEEFTRLVLECDAEMAKCREKLMGFRKEVKQNIKCTDQEIHTIKIGRESFFMLSAIVMGLFGISLSSLSMLFMASLYTLHKIQEKSTMKDQLHEIKTKLKSCIDTLERCEWCIQILYCVCKLTRK